MIFAAAAALLVLQVAATTAVAEEVTMKGNIVCAKCTLKVQGLKDCQNVLMVKQEQQEVQYWLVNNDVTKAYGEVCTAVKPVTVTGTVENKDGKNWIAPTKIEPRSDT
jgi:hypothetical protein